MPAIGYSGRRSQTRLEYKNKSERELGRVLNDSSSRRFDPTTLLKEQYDRFYESSDFSYYDEKTTRRFLEVLLRKGRVLKGARALDVGCGTAYYTGQFLAMGLDVVGIDISTVGVLRGHSRYPSLPLLVGDASRMPFKEKLFDLLFVNGCSLANTRDVSAIRSFLSNLMRYLADTGVLLLLGRSDLSGGTAADSGWVYHTFKDILLFADRESAIVEGPYLTNIRLLSTFGPVGANRVLSFLARAFPLGRKWTFVYYIRKN
jgi:SAM-dependent methyltransferase